MRPADRRVDRRDRGCHRGSPAPPAPRSRRRPGVTTRKRNHDDVLASPGPTSGFSQNPMFSAARNSVWKWYGTAPIGPSSRSGRERHSVGLLDDGRVGTEERRSRHGAAVARREHQVAPDRSRSDRDRRDRAPTGAPAPGHPRGPGAASRPAWRPARSGWPGSTSSRRSPSRRSGRSRPEAGGPDRRRHGRAAEGELDPQASGMTPWYRPGIPATGCGVVSRRMSPGSGGRKVSGSPAQPSR